VDTCQAKRLSKVPQVEYVDHHIEIPVAKHVPGL